MPHNDGYTDTSPATPQELDDLGMPDWGDTGARAQRARTPTHTPPGNPGLHDPHALDPFAVEGEVDEDGPGDGGNLSGNYYDDMVARREAEEAAEEAEEDLDLEEDEEDDE